MQTLAILAAIVLIYLVFVLGWHAVRWMSGGTLAYGGQIVPGEAPEHSWKRVCPALAGARVRITLEPEEFASSITSAVLLRNLRTLFSETEIATEYEGDEEFHLVLIGMQQNLFGFRLRSLKSGHEEYFESLDWPIVDGRALASQSAATQWVIGKAPGIALQAVYRLAAFVKAEKEKSESTT